MCNMDETLPRHVSKVLAEHLSVMPAVVVTGARQTGKSTLAVDLTPSDRRFLTLDDLDVLDLARRDPLGLLSASDEVTLDEIQREPSLLLAVKRVIDRNRRPGQFLLTGSANLLLMRRVSETLAGRAGYLTLWPMTRREQRGLGACGVWEQLLATDDRLWLEVLADQPAAEEDWSELARRGGFPVPALQLGGTRARKLWFAGYVATYLERDLLQLSSISALPDFRRLMRAATLRIGQVLNQTELGRNLALPQPTVHRYLNLLETSYLLVRVPAYTVNRTKRLIKSPKLYWCDPALALHLAGGPDPGGALLENIVLHDLLVWRDSRLGSADLFHWRTTQGVAVDFVVETGNALTPIEVQSSSRPRLRDAKNLLTFRAEYGERARKGLLLHSGEELTWIAPEVLAAPWWMVL